LLLIFVENDLQKTKFDHLLAFFFAVIPLDRLGDIIFYQVVFVRIYSRLNVENSFKQLLCVAHRNKQLSSHTLLMCNN